MKLISSSGIQRVIDELRNCLAEQSALKIASPSYSLFAYPQSGITGSNPAALNAPTRNHWVGHHDAQKGIRDSVVRTHRFHRALSNCA